MELAIILGLIFILLVAGAGTALLVRPGRRRVSAPPAPPSVPPAAPDGQRTAAPPGEDVATATPGVEEVLPPAAGQAPVEPAPAPLRGRLVRLRGRLAASRGGFGSVLLNLLSRDVLDDAAWEEIEDTLITADMGVSPARRSSRSSGPRSR